ncbi:MAG: peptidoglycan-binding domain-containing protein [Pseudomonadota bacterium]
MQMRYFLSILLALVLAVALSGVAAATDGAYSGSMGGTKQPGAAAAKPHAMEGRGGVAPSAQCDKQCVKDVQNHLKQQGLYKAKIDGVPGPRTQRAVKKFQRQQGIQATGQIDEQLLSAMNIHPSGRGGMKQQPPAGGMGGSSGM